MIDDVDFYLIDLKSKFDKIKPNTYYLSYSGGKDSHFLYWFIKEYLHRDDIKIVGINTYMEHPEIRDRILKNSDIVLRPILKPFEIKEKYGIPCFSKEQDFYIYYYQNALRKGKKPSKTIQQKIDGTYDKGFSVFVDGEETETIPIGDGGLIVVPVSEGTHQISFKYHVEGFNIGLILTSISIAGIIVYVFVDIKLRKNKL